jgi:hypothetical protein
VARNHHHTSEAWNKVLSFQLSCNLGFVFCSLADLAFLLQQQQLLQQRQSSTDKSIIIICNMYVM